jgi:hypothetical protein
MSDRRALLLRLAPLALLLVLGVAVALRADVSALRLPTADASNARGLEETLGRLSDGETVLVGFDPDLGTYGEIRPTVRAVLADLLNRGSRLAFISLTPEGRALALAELSRLDRLEANPRQVTDLGYVPGAEAALVSLTRELGTEPAGGVLAALPSGEDLADVGAALVIGGNDLGPRAWVEQLAPRVEGLEIIAIAPTVLLPELGPYLASGQLSALLATPRDGATYRASAELGPLERISEPAEPSTLAIVVGALAAVLILGQAIGARITSTVGDARARESA